MHIFLRPFLIKQKLNVRDKVRDSDWISALRSCSQAPVTIIILKLIIQLYIHIKKKFYWQTTQIMYLYNFIIKQCKVGNRLYSIKWENRCKDQ